MAVETETPTPKAPAADREATIAADFEQTMGKHESFLKADAATQELYRTAHKQLIEERELKSPDNPLNQQRKADQATTDNQGFALNLKDTLKRSLLSAASRIPMVDDLVGQVDNDYPTQVANYLNKEDAAPLTREMKQLAHDMKVWGERTDASGFLGGVKASAQLVGDIVKNPGGVLDVAAQSIGSMASMGAGAKAGSLVAAGATAATGGWAAPAAPFITAAGMFTAEAADAGSAKMVEKIRGGLDERGIAYTPANVKMFMDQNPSLIKEYQADALKYGGILGAADVAMGGFFSKLATLPTRAARQAAMRSVDDVGRAMLAARAAEKGIPLKTLTEDFINAGASKLLAERSFKKKLGSAVTSYAGEVASEPLSEAAATGGIGEEIKAEDLIYETLGGVGAGPIGAGINTAAFGSKLAANKTGEFTKKLLTATPESKAAVEAIKTDTEKAAAQKEARNEHGFKKEVAEVALGDARIEEWSDPVHENYSPVKAITSLAKFADNPEAAVKAEELYASVKADWLATEEKIVALRDKGDQKTLQEKAQMAALVKQHEIKGEVAVQMSRQLLVIRELNNKVSTEKETTPLDVASATTEEVINHTTETYGSSKASLSIQQLDQRLAKPDLPEVERTLLQAKKETVAARQVIESAIKQRPVTDGKTAEAVHEDVYRGDKDFRGIDSYRQAIANFLNPAVNNVEGAKKQIQELAKFHDAHQDKMKQITEAFDKVSQIVFDPKTEPRPTIHLKIQGKNYKIHKFSGKLVALVANEADALQKEVTFAESLLTARTTPVQANTSVAPTTPAVSQPVALDPVVESKTRKYARNAVATLAEGKTTPAILRQKEKQLNVKYGPEAVRVFQEELALATEEAAALPVEPSSIEDVTPVTQSETEESNKTSPVVEKTEDAKSPTKEIKESTVADNTATVSGDISAEPIDPGYLKIQFTDIDGQQVEKTYNEAMIALTQEILEAESILNCFNGK